jgi:hypothetical protein
VQAHFMILKDSLDHGEIHDGRQTIKCSRFFKNDANNLQLCILED